MRIMLLDAKNKLQGLENDWMIEEKLDESIDECQACGGEGEMKAPKVYMNCPCCKNREKVRRCRYCNGKGAK